MRTTRAATDPRRTAGDSARTRPRSSASAPTAAVDAGIERPDNERGEDGVHDDQGPHDMTAGVARRDRDQRHRQRDDERPPGRRPPAGQLRHTIPPATASTRKTQPATT